jgi:glucose-6-phosphate isomerase
VPVSLLYSNALASGLSAAPAPPLSNAVRTTFAAAQLDGVWAERFRGAHDAVKRRREAGDMGFYALPDDAQGVDQVQALVAQGVGQFDDLVLVGIGGSSLGGRAIADALLGGGWNAGAPETRGGRPRLHILENADPDTVLEIMQRLDPRRTQLNIVSKSGSTAETMAQFLVLERWIHDHVGEEAGRRHFVFTTDPASGGLRALANAHGIPSLPVPPSVGGRFSVLSSVGLYPAAATGIDITALLEGAREVREACETPVLRENPAGVLATLLHAWDVEGGAPIHVVMPYADRLRTLGLWFQQLWAESLGKARGVSGAPAGTGPTPVAALGAVDQHSLLQLFMEGPRDKVILFLRVNHRAASLPLPTSHAALGALNYLGGHTMEALLEAERRATAEALRRAGRPSMTLEIAALDARSLGGLFMLFEIATVYAGALYGVDPLDQPGVEAGKILTYGLLGREGYTSPSLVSEALGGARVGGNPDSPAPVLEGV